MVTSSKRTYALSTPETLSLRQTTADPYLHRRCSNTVCLSLYRVPGSWCAQGLFEPSERLWQGQGLILNVNSPLLPSYWGFSSAPRHGVSPHSCSSVYHLTGVFLTLDVGYLFTGASVMHRCHSWPWAWGISSHLLLLTLDMGYFLSAFKYNFKYN